MLAQIDKYNDKLFAAPIDATRTPLAGPANKQARIDAYHIIPEPK